MSYKLLLKRNLKLLYFRSFFQFLIFTIPIWYVFETRFVSLATLGIIFAMSHFISVVLELPSGALADLIGRRKTVFAGLVVYGFGALALSQAQNSLWLWSTYVVFGIADALISGADTALYYDTLKELGRSEDFAKFNANVGLIIRFALVISTFLGGFIYAVHFRLPYVLWGMSVLVAAVISYFSIEPKIDSEKFSFKSYWWQAKLGFKQLFKTEYIKDFSLYYMLVGGVGWYFIYFLNVAFITEIGFDDIRRGVLVSLAYITGALLNVWLTRASWVKRNYIYIGLPILLLIGLLPGAWVGKTYAVIALLLVQFVGLARFTLLDEYANKEFESKYRATAVSALNMAVSIFYIMASSIGGVVIERFGAPMMMTVLGLITFVVALPSAITIIFKQRRGRYG
jgi:MFS family permease